MGSKEGLGSVVDGGAHKET
jgi:hypothetical protein